MAKVILLGIPFDEYSSFTKGPAQAPPKIREELFSDAYNMFTEAGVDLGEDGVLGDAGDVNFNSHEDPWDLIESVSAELVRNNEPVIYLGGDHSITHPILRGFRRKFSRLNILHFDAHPDIYHEFQGNPRSHASPFARIMEEGLAVRLVQAGIRTATAHQREQWKRFGVEVVEAREFRPGMTFGFKDPVYISLDIDGLDPAFAPGVSHREPGGLSVRDIVDIIHGIEARVIGADIVEYNPTRDFGNITATVAAKLTKEIAGKMIQTNSPH